MGLGRSLAIRYHTLDHAYIGRELADKSTAATVADDLRVRVEPGFTPFSLRFNFLSTSELWSVKLLPV